MEILDRLGVLAREGSLVYRSRGSAEALLAFATVAASAPPVCEALRLDVRRPKEYERKRKNMRQPLQANHADSKVRRHPSVDSFA